MDFPLTHKEIWFPDVCAAFHDLNLIPVFCICNLLGLRKDTL